MGKNRGMSSIIVCFLSFTSQDWQEKIYESLPSNYKYNSSRLTQNINSFHHYLTKFALHKVIFLGAFFPTDSQAHLTLCPFFPKIKSF